MIGAAQAISAFGTQTAGRYPLPYIVAPGLTAPFIPGKQGSMYAGSGGTPWHSA